MAPGTRSSHSRLTPAPVQQPMGRQRKTVHRRDSPLKLQKRQSTLTQLAYVHTPHSSRSDAIYVSSGDEDEDYEQPQPNKKRKISGGKRKLDRASLTRSQSTLTQKWDPRAMMMVHDSDEDLDMIERDTTLVLPDGQCQQRDETLSESESTRSRHVRSAASSEIGEQSTRPTTADSTTILRTPNRFRKKEVPSSVTPESIRMSGSSIGEDEQNEYQRSPLKERSVNIDPPKLSDSHEEFLATTGQLKSQLSTIPLNDIDGAAGSQKSWNATLILTPRKDRKLKRAETIQDSEDEDMELDWSPAPPENDMPLFDVTKVSSLALPTIPECSQESEHVETAKLSSNIMPTEEKSVPTPAWKKSGVVLDSEESNEDLVSICQSNSDTSLINEAAQLQDDATNTASNDSPGEPVLGSPKIDDIDIEVAGNEEEPEEYDGYDDDDDPAYAYTQYPQTYDPVTAALDRDAARFGMSETQIAQEQRYSQVETLAIDASGAQQHPQDATAEDHVPSSQQADASLLSTRPEIVLAHDKQSRDQYVAKPVDIDDSGYVSQLSIEAVEIVPSSQPEEVGQQSTSEPEKPVQGAAQSQTLDHDPSRNDPDLRTGEQHASLVASDSQAHNNGMSQAMNEVYDESPALQPSQISTVCYTQTQRNLPGSAHGTQAQSATPMKSTRAWPDTLSSSPFPQPPGVIGPTMHRTFTQGSSFNDFSLPPPPPLPSSIRQNLSSSEL